MLLVSATFFTFFILAALVYHSLTSIPLAELRRQTRNKNLQLNAIYALAVRQAGSKIILWITVGIALSGSVIASYQINPWLLVVIVVIGLGTLMLLSLKPEPIGFLWTVAKISARPVAWFMNYAGPIFDRLAALLGVKSYSEKARIYEKQDLLDLLKAQDKNENSRLDIADTKITEAALSFSSKTIIQLMIPLSKLKMVPANEPIGPHLMDELHDSASPAFLVIKEKIKSQPPTPVGIIYMRSLIAKQNGGKVKDATENKVYFINEDQTPKQALEVLLATNQPLLMVVNRFNELTGALYLADIISSLFPDIRLSDSENHANPKSVAALHANKLIESKSHSSEKYRR